jgi:hypothetical protein
MSFLFIGHSLFRRAFGGTLCCGQALAGQVLGMFGWGLDGFWPWAPYNPWLLRTRSAPRSAMTTQGTIVLGSRTRNGHHHEGRSSRKTCDRDHVISQECPCLTASIWQRDRPKSFSPRILQPPIEDPSAARVYLIVHSRSAPDQS